METTQFRQAITHGLGRVILHLRENSWRPHTAAIEHVCLQNTAYDAQCEGSRAQYVYDIVSLTDDTEYFANLVANGLLQSKEHWDTYHLFHLARLFAQAGDSNAREAMYSKFQKEAVEQRLHGANQIVHLDGFNGLLVVLDSIGRWMGSHPDYWEDDSFIEEAESILGEGTEQRVRQESETNSNIRQYMNVVDKSRMNRTVRQVPDIIGWTYAQLREGIAAGNENLRGYLARWGKNASEEALHQAASDLLNERHEKRQQAYLRIFFQRPFPLDCQKLIEWTASPNEKLAAASLAALRHLQGADIRALALRFLNDEQRQSESLELLAKNYEPRDHLRVQTLLAKLTQEDAFHWPAHVAVKVFELNPDPEGVSFMLEIYERSRCSNCRRRTVDNLIKYRFIPEWMLAECLHDSNQDIRTAAQKYLDYR